MIEHSDPATDPIGVEYSQSDPTTAEAQITRSAEHYGRRAVGLDMRTPYGARNVARMIRRAVYAIDLKNTDYPRRWAALRAQSDRLVHLWDLECPPL